MRNIKLILAYDGTDFHGWQRQQDSRTVQGVLEDALERLTGARPTTMASGRTDAGVHALGQVVQFMTTSAHSLETMIRALNAHLPRDVRVMDAAEVPQSFHPTLDAVSKRYRYVIDNARIGDPFCLRYAWYVGRPLDAERMAAGARHLIGRHDFHSFETNWPNRMSSVRTVLDTKVVRTSRLVSIEVEADGFLYNMVRAIAGTLVMVGSGSREPEWVGDVLRARDRSAAGPTAPPHGLFLLWARYE